MERWKLYAFAAAVFAGLTSVVAKAGLKTLGADLGLAVRTLFVFGFVMLNTFL
jgi:bacterial/archaeal transporter family protein